MYVTLIRKLIHDTRSFVLRENLHTIFNVGSAILSFSSLCDHMTNKWKANRSLIHSKGVRSDDVLKMNNIHEIIDKVPINENDIVLFISHPWLDKNKCDSENKLLNAMKLRIQQFNKPCIIWFDYLCVDQFTPEIKKLQIIEIDSVIKRSNAQLFIRSNDFYSRSWCVFEEILCDYAANDGSYKIPGFRQMYRLYHSKCTNNYDKKIILNKAFNVFISSLIPLLTIPLFIKSPFSNFVIYCCTQFEMDRTPSIKQIYPCIKEMRDWENFWRNPICDINAFRYIEI